MPTDSYPAFLDLNRNTVHPLDGAESFVAGRNPAANLVLADPTCSRNQFRVLRIDGQCVLEPLSQTSPTYCDDAPVLGPTVLAHGSTVRAGGCNFRFLAHPEAKARPVPPPRAPAVPAHADGETDGTVMASPNAIPGGSGWLPAGAGDGSAGRPLSLDEDALPGEIPVAGTLYIGRDRSAQVPLPHPQVSRRHAVVVARNGRADIRDLGSANGTYLNGARLARNVPTLLEPGDRIDVGPFSLRYDGRSLLPRSRSNNVELIATDLKRVVTDAATGRPLTLLDGVSLVIRPHEFACLLGPSGSGKSTLMGILSGRTNPDGGVVLMNGQDLHAQFDALKRDIALVPQKDLLHDTLTVGQVLDYSARLRLPPDISSAETETVVAETLESVQLTTRRGTRVRNLSGGQLKRASLANELLCKPTLLFLDEVTSGLDERTDRDMMELFRGVADGGKTVVCITHSLTNVEQFCHLLVILTPGGKVAFIGSPGEALGYFGIARLGDVYARLEELPADDWQAMFRASPFYDKYVTSRLPAGPVAPAAPVAREQASAKGLARLFVRQARLLAARYWSIWRGSPAALGAMAGQPLLVAVLLAAVFGDVGGIANPAVKAARTESLLFLLAVTGFWFGCNNAAKELVKERAIFTRERDFSLLVGSYYLSKLAVLAVFGLVQVVILYGIVKGWCAPPGEAAGQVVALAGLVAAGTALGLFLSAVSSSEDVAVSLIPVAVIPQVILSAGIAPLSGAALWLARGTITTYWGKRALDGLLPDDIARTARAAELAEPERFWGALVLIGVHAAVFVAAALVVMTVQGRMMARLVHKVKRAVR